VKVALLGAGRIGQLHGRLLAERPEVDAVLVADTDAGRAQELAHALGAQSLPVSAALDAADAVVIAAATTSHAELVRAAAARRRAIFCEKPLAPDVGATRDVIAAVDEAGVPLQVGFQRRFDAAYGRAKQLIDSGALGRLYLLRVAGHDPAPPHEAYIPASGGIFRDFSIHDFDAVRWLTGCEVDEVYADGGVLGFDIFAKYGDVDTAVATMRLTDGALGVLTVARHDPLGYDIRTELFGSRDSVSIGLGPRTPMRSLEPGVPPPAGPAWSNFLERFEDAFRAELGAFLDVAAGRRPSPCTGNDSLQALRIAEAATRSRLEHRPVRLEEID
jgi:myo-inositol 2-dehydrogenase/D-chiro-inositol 1-dehydrogenase